MGQRVGSEGPGDFITQSDSVMGGALGAALGSGGRTQQKSFCPKRKRQIFKKPRCWNGNWHGRKR